MTKVVALEIDEEAVEKKTEVYPVFQFSPLLILKSLSCLFGNRLSRPRKSEKAPLPLPLLDFETRLSISPTGNSCLQNAALSLSPSPKTRRRACGMGTWHLLKLRVNLPSICP
ncbi:hypothetical protein AAMO2058_001218700 [Amorphochlora amoebiformis]